MMAKPNKQLSVEELQTAYEFYKKHGQGEKALKVGEMLLEKQQQPVDYDFSQTAANFFPSLGNVIKDTYNAVANPVETVKAVGGLARSGLANAGQMLQDALPTPVVSGMNRLENLVTGGDLPVGEDAKTYRLPNQQAGEQFLGFLDDRYGSLDALKTTAMQDPAGMLLDASGVLMGGGATVAKAGGTVGKIGEGVQKAGQILDPITGAVKAPVAAIEYATGKPISNMLYESAMKPSTTLSPEQRKKLVEDGIRFNAKPTVKSVERLEAQRQQVFKEISDIEDNAKLYGNLVDPQDLFKYVDDVRTEYAPPILNSSEALKTIDNVVEQQLESIFLNGGLDLTVQDLARIKRKIYEQVSYDKRFGANKIDKPAEKTMKAIARSAKEAIEDVLPSVKEYNKLYGDIVEVQKNLQLPAANRIGNRDMLGIGAPIKIGAGGAIAGEKGLALGATLGILDQPRAKANLAISVNDFGKAVRSPRTAGVLTATSLAGRYEDAALAEHDEMIEEQMANGAIR